MFLTFLLPSESSLLELSNLNFCSLRINMLSLTWTSRSRTTPAGSSGWCMRLSLRNLIGSPLLLLELFWVSGIPVLLRSQRSDCRFPEDPILAETSTTQGNISGMTAMPFPLDLAPWPMLMAKSTKRFPTWFAAVLDIVCSTHRFIAECKSSGKSLMVWTVNEPDHMMEVRLVE